MQGRLFRTGWAACEADDSLHIFGAQCTRISIARENRFAPSIVIESPGSLSQSTGLLNQPSLACTSSTCSPGGTTTPLEKKARPKTLLTVMGCRPLKPCGPPPPFGASSEWPALRSRPTGAVTHFHRTCPGGTTDTSDTTDKAPGYV